MLIKKLRISKTHGENTRNYIIVVFSFSAGDFRLYAVMHRAVSEQVILLKHDNYINIEYVCQAFYLRFFVIFNLFLVQFKYYCFVGLQGHIVKDYLIVIIVMHNHFAIVVFKLFRKFELRLFVGVVS